MCAQWHWPGCGGATQKHHFEQGCENTSKHSKIIYTKHPFPFALVSKYKPLSERIPLRNSHMNINQKYSAIQFSIFNKKLNFIPFLWTDSHKRSKAENKLPLYLHYTIYIKQYLEFSVHVFSSLCVEQQRSSFKLPFVTFRCNIFETIQFFKVSVGDWQY